MEIVAVVVLLVIGLLVLKAMSGTVSSAGSPCALSRDPRERAAAREEAADVLNSDANSIAKLRAIATFRQKATLAVLDGWSDTIFAALSDADVRVSIECARLIGDCVDHGIMASHGISAVSMMPEDAQRIAELINQTMGDVTHHATKDILKATHGKLQNFVEKKRR